MVDDGYWFVVSSFRHNKKIIFAETLEKKKD